VIYFLWEGIASRVRMQLIALDLTQNPAVQEERDLERARELDALEVGRRADARALGAKVQRKDHAEQT
jgi:hypothetical protein